MATSRTGRSKTQPKPRPGAGAITTTAPAHAIRGGVSLLAGPALLILVLVPVLGLILWLAARPYGLNWLGLVLGGTFVSLAVAVHDHMQPRQAWMRRQGSWSLGWTGIVLGWVTAFGPDPMWAGLMLATGIPLASWWFFAKTEPYRGIGTDGHGDGGAWQKAVGLAESTRPTKVQDRDDERHVEVEHTDDTAEDLVKARKRMEAKGRLPQGSIRVEPILEKGRQLAHRSRLVISRSSFLEDVPEWSGPDRPGEGIWVPVRTGWCADRKPSQWKLTPDEDYVGSPSLLSSGQAGAAKTAFELNLIGNIVARRGVVLMGSDVRKAGQWVPFVWPFLDWFEKTPEGAKNQLDALARAVPERTELITSLTGEDRWTPRCWTEHQIPFIVYWMAESAPLMAVLEEELVRGNEVWRSAGIKVVAEIHRPSEGNVSTDFRNLIPESMAFRSGKAEDGRMALDEETLDAGAEPWTISPDMPGLHYAEYVNEPKSRWAMKRRTERPNRQLLAATVAEWMATHPEWHRLDERTAAAFGDAYAKRTVPSLANWMSQRGIPPQLRDESVTKWIPKPAVPAPAPMEEPMEEQDPVPAAAAAEYDEPEGHEHEEGEIAMNAQRVLDQVNADVDQDLGPDPEETPVENVAAELARAEAPQDGDDDPDLDWSPTPPAVPRPSPQQRAENFQTMVRRLFTDRTGGSIELSDGERVTAGVVGEAPDGTLWVTVDTDTLVALWLDFPGEDVRPALYPRLRAHTTTRPSALARQLGRGRWAISEHVLDTPLVIPDEYDPDADAPEELSEEDTERELAEAGLT